MSTLTGIARTSLADGVYLRLVEGIHSGTIAPGAALHVADLATQFNVSPSPVRDAIARLTGEGLVVNNSNRRTTVVTFTRKDIVETFQLRGILECGAVHLASQRATPSQLAELKSVAEQCDSLACVGKSTAGFIYAIIKDPAGFGEECDNSDLIVTRLKAPSYCTAGVVIDAPELAAHGVHWLRWNVASHSFEVRAAIPGLSRPWRVSP